MEQSIGQENSQNFDPNRRSNIDILTMPEIAIVTESNNPAIIAIATRSLTRRIVDVDQKTFGVNLQYQTQNYQLILSGRKAMSEVGFVHKNESLNNEFDRSQQEISDISQLLYWFSIFSKAGKSIDGLVGVFSNMGKDIMLTPDTFERVFNLPKVEGEKNLLGNDIDRIIRACMVIGLSEDKAKLQDLMSRPGWAFLFDGNKDLERMFIGDPSNWSDSRKEDSLETEGANRGLLTKNGNIWARAETLAQEDDVHKALLALVEGNKLALSLGLGIFKIFGMESEYAATKIINKDGKETVLLEGWPNAPDLGKMMHFAGWQTKQTAAGHPCGPFETRKKIDSILLPFLKFAGYKVKLGQSDQTRSLYELMWGYSNANGSIKEKAFRLGEVSWKELVPDIYNDWGTRIVVPGGEKGLFNLLKSQKSDPSAMMTDSFWEALKLNLNVVVSKALLCRGEYGRKEVADKEVEQEKQRIAEIFWEGVKSLPDYDVWKHEPVNENLDNLNLMGMNAPTKKVDFVIRMAKYCGFNFKK